MLGIGVNVAVRLEDCRPSCATRAGDARGSDARARSSRCSRGCSTALARAWREPADDDARRRGASATRCAGARSRGARPRARRGHRRGGRLVVALAGGGHADAGRRRGAPAARRLTAGGSPRAGGSSRRARAACGALAASSSRRRRAAVRRRRSFCAQRARGAVRRRAAAPSPPLRRRRALRARRLGKLRSSSRASAGGLRAMRVRAPRSASSASGVCASAAASSAAARRRSCLRAAWIRRRALRACAPPAELTSRPSRRLVSGQRCTAYSSCTSRVYSASRQIQALAWSRRPMRRSTSARSMILVASRRSSRGQPPMMSIAVVEGVGVAQRGDVGERAQAQLRVLVALDRGDQEAALQLAGAVEVQHRARPAPAVGRDARAGERRPHVLLAVVEVLDGDPPQLALEDREPPLLLGAHRQHAALHAHAPAAPAAHRADDDRPAAVDVAVEQRVQRHDRVVVLGGGVHEVDDEARLLARVAAGDAARRAAGRCAWRRSARGARRRSRAGCSSPRRAAAR